MALTELERLLATKAEVGERDDILPFFRDHPHLTAFLGSYHPNVIAFDRLGLEVPLFGQFQADAITADWARHAFCLVEFEDGRMDSIFARRGRRASVWASRFEQGFSQIVDWLWILDDQRQTTTFGSLFGAPTVDVVTLLVVGRDHGLSQVERHRLAWRRNHVVVGSRRVYCCTYDELLRDLQQRMRLFVRRTSGDDA